MCTCVTLCGVGVRGREVVNDVVLFQWCRHSKQGRASAVTDRAFDSRSCTHFVYYLGVFIYFCKVKSFSRSGKLSLAVHSPLFGLRFSGGIHTVVTAG